MTHRTMIGLATLLTGAMLSACGGEEAQVLAGPGASREQAASTSPPALNPASPPGANFNLSPFKLQLPTGASGKVDTIGSAQLVAGYTHPYYFYTDSTDGAMVMVDPTQGWTTSGSLHPRTELRENAIWPTTGTNKLNATLAVTLLPVRVAIGQIFQGTGPSKPLCELQLTSEGVVQLMLEDNNQGGSATFNPITTVPQGAVFDYELSLTGRTVTVTVNSVVRTFNMDSSFVGESFYFKAGNYDQSAVSGTPLTQPGTIVKFYALAVTHQ